MIYWYLFTYLCYVFIENNSNNNNELYSPLKENFSKVLYSKMAMKIMIYD